MLTRMNGLAFFTSRQEKLVEMIQAALPREYVRADIQPAFPDMMRGGYHADVVSNDTFDVLIANHVLEHVDDLGAANRKCASSGAWRVCHPADSATASS